VEIAVTSVVEFSQSRSCVVGSLNDVEKVGIGIIRGIEPGYIK
jgi:hypothetical protein